MGQTGILGVSISLLDIIGFNVIKNGFLCQKILRNRWVFGILTPTKYEALRVAQYKRLNPKYYDGIQSTSHQVRDLLPRVLSDINTRQQERPEMLLAAWPSIIGEKIAPMTRAVSFREGVLTVAVKNATLFSLLNDREKGKIVHRIRQNFPQIELHNIIFRIG